MSNILLIDCETAPSLAYVWQYYQTNVGAKQVLDHSYIMSYAAKWLDEGEIIYEENRKFNDYKLVESIIKLLDEADIVIAHNAKKFDIPVINARAIVNGLKPPSPYKVIDTYRVVKESFKFGMNSLEYVAKILGCAPKGNHSKFPGFELWLECMRNNEEAWKELKEYNIQDVETLEEVYIKLRPWIKNHPNIGVYKESDKPVCTKCGSHNVVVHSHYRTGVGKYEQYRCADCGGWCRSRSSVYPKDKVRSLLTNAS